ncbi:MAG: 1-deoxy-D-xylulose-5-phosphate reductoisomerase [Vampirovibrionales bacterium]|nr:1-deoxy-D-xylulose-5-phosphate reductoisomerase [Vampirovibrionales bacterium]
MNNDRKHLCVLGSTGSIGTQVLDVVRHFPNCFKVEALAAGKNIALLAEQIIEFRPSHVVIKDSEDIAALKSLLVAAAIKPLPEIISTAMAMDDLAAMPEVDTVIVGLVGLTGLAPTMSALQAGKRVLSANKETFVAGGHLAKPYLKQIIPLDSEHSAIFQCLAGASCSEIAKIVLTASGGPFRKLGAEALANVSTADALKHPNWVMGQKVTIDSATLMNKGLEVIEAHWLFGVDYPQIEVVIHPQSIVHSGVTFVDGVSLLQLGAPDMRAPIQYGMFYPNRVETPFDACKFSIESLNRLDFEPPDKQRFPCLELAYEAGRIGGSMPAVLNAADEIAVQLFLAEKIGLMDIPRLIEKTMAKHHGDGVVSAPSLAEIRTIDHWARTTVTMLANHHPAGLLSISH